MSVFNKVAVRKPRMSKFNLTNSKKFSTNPGYLTPIMCTDVLPGDIFKISNEMVVRFAPLVAPVMHDASCSVYHFFVPNRIIWKDWEKFISPETIDQVPVSMPTFNGLNAGTALPGSIADYLGVPTGVTMDWEQDVSVLPFVAIHKIWNEYFRDQNLQDKLIDDVDEFAADQDNVEYVRTRGNLPKVAWPHDYLTSSLPFAQKGQPVSIGTQGEFQDVAVFQDADENLRTTYWRTTNGDPIGSDSNADEVRTHRTTNPAIGSSSDDLNNPIWLDLEGSLYKARTSDLSAPSITINDLRVAIKTQEFLERQARGGSRYTENLRIQWGVRSSDQRLNRPEFIGTSHGPVQISEVLQTSESTEASPLATMSGHGISAGRTRSFRYRAEEHGWLLSFMVVRPVTAYQQGLPRMFSRKTLFDFAVPILAHIGEQEVLNKEVYYDEQDGLNNETFGYQPRYQEYRHINSTVAGDFRDQLSFWHWGRIFAERPTLSKEFIECTPRSDIFAVTSEDVDHLWCHSRNIVTAVRKLPRFGTPLL